MSWFGALLDPIVGLIKEPIMEYQKRKTIEVELEAKILDRQHELNLKKMDIAGELAKQGVQVEADWDARAQADMATSWKDEYLLILFSIPLVLSFFPATQEAILKGFAILEQTPEWYMFLVIGIVSAVYGLRWYVSKSKN